MAEERKEREPWSPRIEKEPLFVNSADFERGLGQRSDPPDITEDSEEEDEDKKASGIPSDNPLKPSR
ncbi:MAG TPA: hypothetical protein VGV09_09310 [Steroidobacteraceae bacterium]|nr:hypothetical protein [Steroidobacteraceae bacterium]